MREAKMGRMSIWGGQKRTNAKDKEQVPLKKAAE
jgi:hypothetical protein